MNRRMNIATKMNAVWEIISTAEYVEELERDVNNADMLAIYQGNFVPLMLDERTSRKQIWNVSIITVAEHEDGTRHTHEMEWSMDKPMTMKEVLDGAKHVKVIRDGIKVRWKGLAKEWTSTVDEDLAGLTAISAWATASCEGYIAKANPLMDVYSIQHGSNSTAKYIKQEEVKEYVQRLLDNIDSDVNSIFKRLDANRNYLGLR